MPFNPFRKSPERKAQEQELREAEKKTRYEAYRKGRLARARHEGYKQGRGSGGGFMGGAQGFIKGVNAGVGFAEGIFGVSRSGSSQRKPQKTHARRKGTTITIHVDGKRKSKPSTQHRKKRSSQRQGSWMDL